MKVGIFSGTFDPVHKGHIAFALKSAESIGLEKVFFLPEAVPRRKDGVTHYAHRIAMLRLAIKPYHRLDVLDLPDKQFTVKQTLPRLMKHFPNDQLYMLIGSDAVPFMANGSWSNIHKLIASMTLVVGLRQGADKQAIDAQLQPLVNSRPFHIITTDNEYASSSDIRSALMRGHSHVAALRTLDNYIRQNWLYVSVALKKS